MKSPTLLLVGECDHEVVRVNEEAYARLSCKRELTSIPRAKHRFEEEGALEDVARLAAGWFRKHLRRASVSCQGPN